jgi:hypothetical protein
MKTTFITILLLATMNPARSQGIFNQNNTQRKYLMEQIAMLQTYLGYVKQGNKVIKDGTNLIGGIKEGEINLHRDYFGSLKKVNGRFSGNEKVKAIIAMQQAMAGSRKSTINKALACGLFGSKEMELLKKLYADLAAEAEKDLDELTLVTTDGQLEMTDDQRIREIDRLYLLMQQKYALQRVLNNNVHAFASGRRRSLKDIENFRGLYGQ